MPTPRTQPSRRGARSKAPGRAKTVPRARPVVVPATASVPPAPPESRPGLAAGLARLGAPRPRCHCGSLPIPGELRCYSCI